MLYLPFPILLLTAFACWVLSGRVQTRRLGYLAALAVLASLGLIAVARMQGSLPILSASYTWAEAAGFSVVAGLRLDGLTLLLSLILLSGGAICLWSLARSLAAGLTGYGGLFAALLVVISGGLLALLSADLLLLAFGWGVVILGSALARRGSGAADERPTAPLAIVQPGALLLLGAVLLFGLDRGGFALNDLSVAPVSLPVFAAWLVAAGAAMGLPLLSRPIGGEGSPMQLQGLLLGIGLPFFAGYSLLRLCSLGAFAGQPWPVIYNQVLLAIGALTLVTCSAAALQSRNLGAILSWQLSAQLGLLLLALGIGTAAAIVAAIALLVNAALTTLVAGMALGALVRRTGSEDLSAQPRLESALAMPGLAYTLAAGSAVGLAPLWGFWGRLWLLDAGGAHAWLLPLLLLGSGLLAVSYLGPLALFWRGGAVPASDAPRPRSWHLPLLVGALLVGLPGLLPSLVWQALLGPALRNNLPPSVSGDLQPALPGPLAEALVALSVLILLILAWRRGTRRQAAVVFSGGEPAEVDEGTPLAPTALGASLTPLGLLARPARFHQFVGQGLQQMSRGVSWALQIVSGRYYLTGIFMAMVILLILMIA